ncbi:hypothetical protein F441_18339 [Phytophthora nicotianae CJ01A1]|uniref:Uncharacterized protein n=3 Tax=Phytophthora nicotianae TaxID=4792 RepID=W2PAB0_PHYN3|nr:hypothetical protein PPTG_20470 [Phytophthora nicotianae INRA-310]ETM97178.1 hypothetical protein PPTG_20470 [Phytophthora nicotianae INRA-310]ETO63887.1 hypothetical protein F444_18480 [Phytophthora nicotianae P1976]ETP04969.1 hypothetical protein F441_18339 [Phytophthora nicotianae CJ01A1]
MRHITGSSASCFAYAGGYLPCPSRKYELSLL